MPRLTVCQQLVTWQPHAQGRDGTGGFRQLKTTTGTDVREQLEKGGQIVHVEVRPLAWG